MVIVLQLTRSIWPAGTGAPVAPISPRGPVAPVTPNVPWAGLLPSPDRATVRGLLVLSLLAISRVAD